MKDKRKQSSVQQRTKQKKLAIFGESSNDLDALVYLALAVRPDLPLIEKILQPSILRRSATMEKRRNICAEIAALMRAKAVKDDVVAVIVHRDCDEVEPAHEANSAALLSDLLEAGVPQPITATPAFEIESWWFLWPAAVSAVRPCWMKLNPGGKNVGTIQNAKEQLRRSLRNNARKSCPDFTESDGTRIALNVKSMNLANVPSAQSSSFDHFKAQIVAASW